MLLFGPECLGLCWTYSIFGHLSYPSGHYSFCAYHFDDRTVSSIVFGPECLGLFKYDILQITGYLSNPSDQSSLCTCHFQMKKLESIVKHRDTQFKHDLKKKEREINKMKERIHQLLTDKNQERRIGK